MRTEPDEHDVEECWKMTSNGQSGENDDYS